VSHLKFGGIEKQEGLNAGSSIFFWINFRTITFGWHAWNLSGIYIQMYLPKLVFFTKNCGQMTQCFGVSILYDIYTVAIG